MSRFPLALAVLVMVTNTGTVLAADDVLVRMSPRLERAIDKGLAYLARTQNEDGSWSSPYGKNVGVVSLCLMAFMSVGNLPGEGKYGHVVAKGVNWILKQAKSNGLIQYTKQSRQAPVMYGHALSTLMLSEVWGQTRRNDIGQVLRKAVDLIVRVQGPKGGWNYQSIPRDGDTSVCVMQIIALKSAHDAGIYVPKETIERALNLIKNQRYNPKVGGYGYSGKNASFRMPGSWAAGTCIMHICGERDPKYIVKPLLNLIKGMEKKQIKGHMYYFCYYTSVCSYGVGEKYFARWIKVVEPWLIKHQRADGRWGGTYQTAFAVLAGAMPYRYLPIYQR